jgi:ribulose 1,5-bisphosphate carboxylase large subunit-like protein
VSDALELRYSCRSQNVGELGEFMARINTVACAMPVLGETQDSVRARGGRYSVDGPTEFTIEIPAAHLTGSVAEILLSIYVDAHPSLYESMTLEDLVLPQSEVRRFAAAVDRPYLHDVLVGEGRPMLIGVVKPSHGLLLDQHIQIAREMLLGGADVAKDDENLLCGDPLNPIGERVGRAARMILEAREITGRPKLYVLNVQHELMIEQVLREVDKYSKYEPALLGILVSPLLGLPMLRTMRLRTTAPIFVHSSGNASLLRSQVRLSLTVYAKFLRMIGMDAVVNAPPFSDKWGGSVSEATQLLQESTIGFAGLPRLFCCFGGGLGIKHVRDTLKSFPSADYGYLVGGAICAHEGGVRAGAAALLALLRQESGLCC